MLPSIKKHATIAIFREEELMWFRSALIYHYDIKESLNLANALDEDKLKPCPPHARFIYGWLPVIADELVHEISGCSLICLGKEERILPRSVIKRLLEDRIESIQQAEQRIVRRTEKSQIAEDLEFELLPKAFCVQKKMHALFDTMTKRLIINSSSNGQASQLISSVKKVMPDLQITPLSHDENLSLLLAKWINEPNSLPQAFELASECVLFSQQDVNKRVNCKGYELPAEEILALLSQGLVASEISLIWQDRIQFTLTHDLSLKRLKCLDYLADEFQGTKDYEEERLKEDAALTLMGGNLRELINDLLTPLTKTNPAPTLHEENEQYLPA